MAWLCSNCWPAMVSSTRAVKPGKAKSGGGGGMLSMVSAWWGKRVDGAKGAGSGDEQQRIQKLGRDESGHTKKKGQGWGVASKLTDEGAKERKMLGYSHSSKDKILLLLMNSHY